MWERARESNPDQPHFDRALYDPLKAEGYLLKDVLDEGLRAIGDWNPAVAESGLTSSARRAMIMAKSPVS